MKNINSYLNLHKTIPVITVEEQNSWSQNGSIDKNIEFRCSARYAKFVIFLLLSFCRSRFYSRFSSFLRVLTDIYKPLPKIHEIDSSRTFQPQVQNEHRINAREASINQYGDI